MKNLVIISTVIALQCLSVSFLHAQNLSERLGAVQTDFVITSHGMELEVTNQIIAKRAERFYDWGGHNDGAYGYGYGYESFHLEFTVKNGEIDLPQPGGLLKGERRAILDFYDAEDNLLGSIAKAPREVRLVGNNTRENKLMHYTIDLINTPLPLLDATKRIDIYRE